MMSYAGIALADADSSIVGPWIVDVAKPYEFFPTSYRAGLSWLTNGPLMSSTPEEPRAVRINTLYWPWGASRCARGYFVVTKPQLDQIRQAVYSPPGFQVAKPFVFSDDVGSLTTLLWMLPAVPMQQIGTQQLPEALGFYLLPLVDERYWWWGTVVDLAVTVGVTNWTDLYASIATALGITITPDVVNAAYAQPPVDYVSNRRLAPELLDIIAFSVGQRVVRKLDGTVVTQNYSTAAAAVTANRSRGYVPFAGGVYAFNPLG